MSSFSILNSMSSLKSQTVETYNNADIKSVNPIREKVIDKKPSKKEKVNSTLFAILGYGIVFTAVNSFFRIIANGVHSQSVKEMDEETLKSLSSKAKDAINNSDLQDKGVKILVVSKENAQSVKEAEKLSEQWFRKHFKPIVVLIDRLPEKQKQEAYKELLLDFFKNKNCYIDDFKTIILSGDKKAVSAFHEIGHAINANSSKSLKYLQKMRGIQFLAPVIGLFSIFTSAKNDTDEHKLSFSEKTVNFIRNNAGKLSFICMLPMFIEEGIASVKGIKIAKNYVTAKTLESLKDCYKANQTAYGAKVFAIPLAIYAGVKIKDNFSEMIKKINGKMTKN